jgi:nitroreductase
MNDILQFLLQRNSASRLIEPAPSAVEMDKIFRAAMRAPDHGWLRPWRFITITGGRRIALGELFERCLMLRKPGADEPARAKARNAPLRAPLLVVVVAKLTENHKVPVMEQRLSAGCAAQAMMLAAEACGYAGIWRTGDATGDSSVLRELGLAVNEEIIGIVYLGSRDGAPKPVPALNPTDFVSAW